MFERWIAFPVFWEDDRPPSDAQAGDVHVAAEELEERATEIQEVAEEAHEAAAGSDDPREDHG